MLSLPVVRLSKRSAVVVMVVFGLWNADKAWTQETLGSVGSSLQTADGAAQLSLGFGNAVLSGTVPSATNNGGYPLLAAAPLNISLQPTVVWAIGVTPYNPSVLPPGETPARPRPMTDTETSFAWRKSPDLQTANTARASIASSRIYGAKPAPSWAQQLAGSDDEFSSDSDADSTTSPINSSVLPASAATPTPEQALLGTSCLDSLSGCASLTLPAPVSLPSTLIGARRNMVAASQLHIRPGYSTPKPRAAQKKSQRSSEKAPDSNTPAQGRSKTLFGK